MLRIVKAGVAGLVLAALVFPAYRVKAADLDDGWRRQDSLKDSFVPSPMRRVAGPCYLRGDIGYAVNMSPDIRFPSLTTGQDQVGDVSADDNLVLEAGVGCGSGSRGLRGEVAFGYRSAFDSVGTGQATSLLTPSDQIHVATTAATAMFNGYYDLGNFRGFTPYVGLGIGLSYLMTDDVHFTGTPALANRIEGDSKLSLAWSVMAGVGYRVSERVILDLGYRYIDLGAGASGHLDDAGNYNPRVRTEDLTAHEIKIGLRYHFGAGRREVVEVSIE